MYELNDATAKKMGEDLWTSVDIWGDSGWHDINYAGGKDYGFDYNYGGDANNRTLEMKEDGMPGSSVSYNLGSRDDFNRGDIDFASLGREVWGSGNNRQNNYWGDFYNMKQMAPPRPDPIAQTRIGAQYTPPYPNAPMGGDAASEYGFGVAADVLEQNMQTQKNFPDWWGSDYQNYDQDKWAAMYPDFVNNPDLGQSYMPGKDYKGLMNGDYGRLEEALGASGRIAADDAYNAGNRNLNAFMGNSGMYGSSVMAQQANEGLNREYMNAQAANAAQATASRYGMEQNDRQFGANYGLQYADLARMNNLDQWKAGVTNQSNRRDYDTNKFQFGFKNSEMGRGERNALARDQNSYALQKEQWHQQIQEQLMNQSLNLARGGAPLTTASMNYQNQQNLIDSRENDAMWGLGLNAVGGFFGAGSGGWDNSMAKSVWDSW